MDALHFKHAARAHLMEGVQRIHTCLALIDDTELWHDPGPHLVSIGNLIKHLGGNVSQYVLKGLGGATYHRDREAEFRMKPGQTRDAVEAELSRIIDRACTVIDRLADEALDAPCRIQGFDHTGTSAILHVVEHFSYHVGQITFAVKQLKERPTDYYAGHDLNRQ